MKELNLFMRCHDKENKTFEHVTSISYNTQKLAFFVLLLVLLDVRANSLAAQFARPNGTVSPGGWRAVGSSTLHDATDEITPNGDTDFAFADEMNTSSELSLSNVVDPSTKTGQLKLFDSSVKGGVGLKEHTRKGCP